MTTIKSSYEKVTREVVEREGSTLDDLLDALFEVGYRAVVTFTVERDGRRYRLTASLEGETTGLAR